MVEPVLEPRSASSWSRDVSQLQMQKRYTAISLKGFPSTLPLQPLWSWQKTGNTHLKPRLIIKQFKNWKKSQRAECQKVTSLFNLDLIMWFALANGTLADVIQAEVWKVLGIWGLSLLAAKTTTLRNHLPRGWGPRHPRCCSLPSWDNRHVSDAILEDPAPTQQTQTRKTTQPIHKIMRSISWLFSATMHWGGLLHSKG